MGRVQPERASVPHVQLQACHPRPAAAIGRAARTATFDGMWLRTDASAANTIVSVPASSANNCEGPDSSAHAPAYDEPMPPMRLVGFAVVWLALVVFTVDTLRAARAYRRRSVPAVPAGV